MSTDPSPIPGTDNDYVLARVEDQIQWYERKSSANLRWFKALKTSTIVVATLIPLVSGATSSLNLSRIAGSLGALVAIMEGIQHLNQFQSNWIIYRSACEALRHEKFLCLALAGPYAGSTNPRTMLAERAEAIVFQEHAKWTSVRAPAEQGNQPQENNRTQ